MIRSAVKASFIGLFFISCAGAPEAVVHISDGPRPVQVKQEPRHLWVLTGTETRFPDGQLIGSTISQYDSTGRLSVEETRDARSRLTGRRQYEYSADGAQNVSVYSGTGDLVSRIRREARNELVVFEEVLDEAGRRQSSSTYQYDTRGNRLVWEAFSGSGMIRTVYRYENGLPVEIQILDGNSKLIKRYERSYSTAGDLEQETEFDASAVVQRRTAYLYKDGVLIRESVHLASGAVRSAIEYRYDSNGNVSDMRFLDRNGRISEIRSQTWQLLVLP